MLLKIILALFIYLFVNSFNKHLLDTYYISYAVKALGT